jgi:hypothetical protein
LRGIAIVGGLLFVLALLLGWATLARDSEIQAALRGRPPKPPLDETAQSGLRTKAPPTAIATEPILSPEPPTPPQQKPATIASEAPKSPASVTHSAVAPVGHGVGLAAPLSVASVAPTVGASEPSPVTPTAPTSPAAASSGKKFRLGSR